MNGGRLTTYSTCAASAPAPKPSTDRGETTDVAAQHPDVVARLTALAERARADMGDALTKRTGTGTRAPGRVPAP